MAACFPAPAFRSRSFTVACISLLALSIARAVSAAPVMPALPQSAAPLTFDPAFLQLSDGDKAKKVNLSYFSYAGGQQPGKYRVDILLNGQYTATATLEFQSLADKPGQLYACVTPDIWRQWGIVLPDAPQIALHKSAGGGGGGEGGSCAGGIARWISGATERLDLNRRQLQITVPQQYLAPPGWFQTPPGQWDQGMPAVMVNYSFSGSEQTNSGQHYRSQFLSLDSQLNFHGWRLHHDGNWLSDNSSAGKWQPLNSWLQHDYASGQGGQLTLGQISTDSSIFDSFPFTGIQAASDDGMIRSELTSYAPVIRGIAYSQAQVTVRQNDTVVYQQNVPPGAFAFRDVPQLYSGEVTVEVREADGTVHKTVQTAASVPDLQREGRLRYSIAAGRYRQSGSQSASQSGSRSHPEFMQATAAWGLPLGFTVHGGAIIAQGYQSGSIGAGRYFATLGAASFSVTQSRSRLADYQPDGSSNSSKMVQGQSWRVNYARSFSATDTSLNLEYRYTSRDFYSFSDLQQQQNPSERTMLRQRSQLITSLSQSLGSAGQISLSGMLENYHHYQGQGYNWTATYNVPLASVSASLSLGYSRTPQYQQADKSVFLNLSVPLSFRSGRSISANLSATLRNGQSRQQAGISGSLYNSRLSYSIMQSRENQGQGAGGSVNLAYQGGYGQLSGSYSYQRHSQQWLYSASGGITLHGHGITFSSPLSLNGGNALVEAPGADGVPVLSGTGLATDWRGYTVVPNLVPYQRNTIELDIANLAADVDIQATNNMVIPARGALVAAPFRVSTGGRALISLTYQGQPVPFGSMVTVQSASQPVSGIVADDGQVYLSGLPEKGQLKVSWGSNPQRHCVAAYRLAPQTTVFNNLHAECR